MNYLLDPIKKYAVFKGRDTRKQFWLFFLWYMVILWLLGIILPAFLDDQTINIIVSIYQLALLLPYIGIGTRRLHDSNKSGWWWLIAFTGIGVLFLLIFWALPSTQGPNKYGEPAIN